MPLSPRAALLPAAALLVTLSACTARQTAANQAEATCRDQAIRDTSELPGIVADTDRDRMVRACLARQPH